MKKIIVFNILLTITLSATFLQDTNNIATMYNKVYGTAKIDSLNNYAIHLGRKNPDLRMEIGRKCFLLSEKEDYQLGLLQSSFNIGAGFFHKSEFDSAMAYYKMGNKIAIENNFLDWEMNFATNIGQTFSNKYMFDSANVYYNIGIEKAKLEKDTLAVGYLYNSIGATYWKKGEFSNAIKYYKFGLKIHKKTKHYKRMSRSYNSIGSSYWNLNNNILALEYYLEALETQKHFSKESSALTLNNVGLLYLQLEDSTLAKKYFVEGLKSATSQNSLLGKGYSFLNFGDLNVMRKKYDKALEYYNRAIVYYRELKDKNGIAQILNKIGEVYLITEQYKLAEKNFLEAYRVSKINRLKLTQTESLINFCRIQIYQGKDSKVIQNLEKALQFAEAGKFSESKLKIYKLQSDVYENLRNYKKSLFFHHKYDELRDSLFSENRLRILSDTKEKYESAKKEQINSALQHINQIQEIELENQKTEKLYVFVISIFSFLVIIYLIYLSSQQKKRNIALQKAKNDVEVINAKLNETNKLLQHSNSTKDKFFSIISHDLKNPFNTLLGATQILQTDFDEMTIEENKELIEIIYNDSEKLYSLLENLLYWANSQTGKLQANKTNIFLHHTLNEIYNLYKSSAESKKITIKIDVPKSLIIVFDQFMLSTIVRNLLSNAIKFTSKNETILIAAFEKNKKIHLSVTDEGVGIKPENISKIFDQSSNYKELGTNKEKGTGLGLILCNDFAKENSAELKVTSTLGKGTSFTLIADKAE